MAGSIILLNGTSSSGKTSIATELQQILPSPWVVLSADRVLGGFPFDHPACEIGDVWRPLGRLFYETVARFAESGFDVIAEQVFQDSRQLEDAVDRLAGHRIWFVGVRCDLDVVERREQARTDGTPSGTARQQVGLVHRDAVYDLEVDTSDITAAQAAQTIAEGINRHPSAFVTLRSAHTGGAPAGEDDQQEAPAWRPASPMAVGHVPLVGVVQCHAEARTTTRASSPSPRTDPTADGERYVAQREGRSPPDQ